MLSDFGPHLDLLSPLVFRFSTVAKLNYLRYYVRRQLG